MRRRRVMAGAMGPPPLEIPVAWVDRVGRWSCGGDRAKWEWRRARVHDYEFIEWAIFYAFLWSPALVLALPVLIAALSRFVWSLLWSIVWLVVATLVPLYALCYVLHMFGFE
jgi:hypothetical protein